MPPLSRCVILALSLIAALALPSAGAADDKAAAQAQLRSMRKETLAQLYQENPNAKKQIRASAGYGVFGVVGAQVLIFGGSGGSGLVRDNLTGRDTFMKVGAVSAGLGVGFKEVRTVLIFNKRDTLKKFLDEGWIFGGEAAAVAKTEIQGGSKGELEMPQGITLYQLTKTGLMAHGTVQGTKYWKDDELN